MKVRGFERYRMRLLQLAVVACFAVLGISSWSPVPLPTRSTRVPSVHDRQSFIFSSATTFASLLGMPGITSAAVEEDFVRQTDQFAYSFKIPSGFLPGNKPLKTHLDEINFSSETIKSYQYGITVDPVRINSMQEFGTPEEVAAKVVLAEVKRDGVFDVTLMEDPLAGPNFVQLNYKSEGKRGTKRFVTKFYISKQKLYALTAQVSFSG